jgi:hypothetical protein
VLKYRIQDDRPVFNALLKYTDIRPCPLDDDKFAAGPTFRRLTEAQRQQTVIVHNTNFELAHVMKRERFKMWKLWNNDTDKDLGSLDDLKDDNRVDETVVG